MFHVLSRLAVKGSNYIHVLVPITLTIQGEMLQMLQ